MPRRCALGCTPTKGVLHVFPNPNKFPEQFKAWNNVVSGKTESSSDYTKMRICDRHFVEKDRNRNNRLNALAVPSLFLHDNVDNVQLVQVPCEPDVSSSTTSDQALGQSQVFNIDLLTSGNVDDVQVSYESAVSKSSRLNQVISESQVSNTDLLTTGKSPNVSFDPAMDHNYCKPSSRPLKAKRLPSAVTSKVKVYQRTVKNLRRQVYRLRGQSKNIKTRLKNAEKLFNKSDFQKVVKNMSTSAKIFTNMQYYQAGKKSKGRRFKIEEKVMSLSLYKRSPKCYALMSKYFILPSPKSLKRVLAKIQLSPGINKIIFEKLKKTVKDLNPEDRLCTIIFDEMSLMPQVHYDSSKDELKGFASHGKKNIANHALVFMAKGIRKQYKQPVAYYFTNSLNKCDLKAILKEIITHVQDTGLTVLSTVCDQSTVNVSTINDLVEETRAKYLRKGKEVNHIFYEINKKKIIPLYDVPHLLKGLRNNLLTKSMIYVDYEDGEKQKEVKWEYLQKLYAADKSFGELRCLQKITEEHIVPEKIKKMRVKTAAQIFSHSVAVATEHLTARGNLPQECRDLIPITLLIDNVFDSLNGSSFQIPNGKQFKGPVKRNSPHHELWQKAIKYFKSMKFIQIKKTGNKIRKVETVVPSVKNFVKTIEGMQQLWKILSQKYAFDAMLTRNFNQDPLENFFGSIRNCGARNTAPNAVAFEGAFKSLLLNYLNAPHSAQANCEEDVNIYLQSLEFFLTEKNNDSETDASQHEIILKDDFIYDDSKKDTDVGQRNYVCGWVLRKCLKNIIKNCKTCREAVICTESNEYNAFIRAKEYSNNKKWLCYPSKQLEECFHDVQNICVSILQKDAPKVGLKNTIKIFVDIFVNFPFECAKHKENLRKYFENITLNVIIYSWCRSINRILAGKLTYNGDDEMKLEAQAYYNKNKHNKINK